MRVHLPVHLMCIHIVTWSVRVCVCERDPQVFAQFWHASGVPLLMLLFSGGAPYPLWLALPTQPTIITARGIHTRMPVTQELHLNHQTPNRSAWFSWGPLRTHHRLTPISVSPCHFSIPHFFVLPLLSLPFSLSLYASAAQHCWRQQPGSPL